MGQGEEGHVDGEEEALNLAGWREAMPGDKRYAADLGRLIQHMGTHIVVVCLACAS